MKLAKIAVLNEDGSPFWSGSLHQFCRDNGFGREFIADMRADMRANQPHVVGGGAAPIFLISLVV